MVAVDIALVVEVSPEGGDVGVEQREALVDLLLRVWTVLGEHALEQEPEDHLALLALGGDPAEPSVDEVRAEHLVLVACQVEAGKGLGERFAVVRPVALGSERLPASLRRECREPSAQLADAVETRSERAGRVWPLLRKAGVDEHVDVAPNGRQRLPQLPGEGLRVGRPSREAGDDPQPVHIDERPEAGEQRLVHAASLRSATPPAPATLRGCFRTVVASDRTCRSERACARRPGTPSRSARRPCRSSRTTRHRGDAARHSPRSWRSSGSSLRPRTSARSRSTRRTSSTSRAPSAPSTTSRLLSSPTSCASRGRTAP